MAYSDSDLTLVERKKGFHFIAPETIGNGNSHVVPNLYDFLPSVEHKIKYFNECFISFLSAQRKSKAPNVDSNV